MRPDQNLAARVHEAVAREAGPLLERAGFTRGSDGWFKRRGELYQVVRPVGSRRSQLSWAALGVSLEVIWLRDHEDQFGPGTMPSNPVEPSARRFLETRLWDLIPGRVRGGAWTVTWESALDVVAADVVAALRDCGLPYLDELTRDVHQLPAAMKAFEARGLFPANVDWRERQARVLWLLGDRGPAEDRMVG